MTRRIVHLTTFLQGGAGRAIADLACAQHHAGDDVLVIASATSEPGYGNYPAYIDRLALEGVPVVLVDSLFKRDAALNDRAFERLCALRSPTDVDIVHAHAAVPAMIGLRFARRARQSTAREARVGCVDRGGRLQPVLGSLKATPMSSTQAGPVVIQTQHGWGTNKTAAQATHDLGVLCAVDRVVATSEATRAFLISAGVERDRIETVPCGLSPDTPLVSPEGAAYVSALRRAGGFIVGCVGSVNDNKNQRLVLEALARTNTRTVRAVFIGEGGESLAEHASALGIGCVTANGPGWPGLKTRPNVGTHASVDHVGAGFSRTPDAEYVGAGFSRPDARVHIIGYRDDADRWIELFDALIVPSRSEGQGLVVLEAFRAGVPVVASNIAPLRELVTDYESGWLFETDDAESLAEAIERAAAASDDVRGRIIETASRRFFQRYTIEAMVARHESVYDSVRPVLTRRRPA